MAQLEVTMREMEAELKNSEALSQSASFEKRKLL